MSVREARGALGDNGDGVSAVGIAREREGGSGRVLVSAVCRGVHDGVDGLTNGASAGVWTTWVQHAASPASSPSADTASIQFQSRLKLDFGLRLTPKSIDDFAG